MKCLRIFPVRVQRNVTSSYWPDSSPVGARRFSIRVDVFARVPVSEKRRKMNHQKCAPRHSDGDALEKRVVTQFEE